MSKLICVICDKPIPVKRFPNGGTWAGGNNAEPAATGRCCDFCHDTVVLPMRFAEHFGRKTRLNEAKE